MKKIKLSLSITILLASIILGGFYYISQVSKQKSIEKQNQITLEQQKQLANNKADSLQKCLNLNLQDYQNEQDSLCEQMNQSAGCLSFIGSPKDIEFTKLRQTDDQLCLELYK